MSIQVQVSIKTSDDNPAFLGPLRFSVEDDQVFVQAMNKSGDEIKYEWVSSLEDFKRAMGLIGV